MVLVLHNTTEFSYRRNDRSPLGLIGTRGYRGGRGGKGPPRLHTIRGILMHGSLAVTTAGLPLGLAAVKFWTRKKFKHTNALRGKICATRVPIEAKEENVRWLENLRQSTATLAQPRRLVHIGDRESDIYELFCAAAEEGTNFLVRTCVNRLAVDGTVTIAEQMRQAPVRAVHRIELRNAEGEARAVVLELRYQRMVVCPPIGKHRRYPRLQLTVLHAQERQPPPGCDPIQWKLLTNLPVRSRAEAVEKLDWYSQRWKIESFHKIPEIRLPRRGIATANGPPARQPSGHPQHPFVARLLADHARPDRARSRRGRGLHASGTATAPCRGPTGAAFHGVAPLPDPARPLGRLPGARSRPASRQPGRLAWIGSAQ